MIAIATFEEDHERNTEPLPALTVAQRVQRGIALLDSRKPGWQPIDLQRLDLMSDCDCVLGQLYGSYSNGLDGLFDIADILDTTYHQDTIIASYGFAIYPFTPPAETYAEWKLLQDAWVKTLGGNGNASQ